MKKRIGLIAMLAVAGWVNTTSVQAAPVAPPKYANEWTFESDDAGLPLSLAINSGTNSPLAQFEAGFGTTVYTTNMLGIGNVLLCTGEGPGTNGAWIAGAVLDASLPPASTGVHYLRYDVEYDFSSPSNNSGTVLGVYFTGGAGDKAAGLVLGYNNDKGDLASQAATAGRTLTSITNGLTLVGKLTAIAEVNLDDSTLKVWYSLDGSNPAYASHAFTTNIALTSITNLRFHATGDFRPAGSSDYAAVDNIRHTIGTTAGGSAWSEISEAVVDLTQPPALTVEISDSQGGGMLIGDTNVVSVIIRNSGGPATDVTSTLIYDSSFTLIASNKAPVSLYANASITNTYTLVAGNNGSYTLTAQAFSAEANSAPEDLLLFVGANLKFVMPPAVDMTGGVSTNYFEPGETRQITIVTTNNSSLSVSNVVNSLQAANGSLFSITNLTSSVYANISPGATATTVYQVVVSPNAPHGPQTFYTTNSSPVAVWGDSFAVNILRQGIPGVSTNALTIVVPTGETRSGNVTLSNSGNASVGYSVSDDGRLPSASYSVSTQSVSRIYFNPSDSATNTVFTNWNNDWSAPSAIGFNLPVFGKLYHTFEVNRQGVVRLTGDGGIRATLNVYGGMTAVPTNSIRFEKKLDRLVVAWGNGSSRELQAVLEPKGTLRFLYQSGTWSGGTISVSDSTRSQTLSHTPGLTNRDALVLQPEFWVSYGAVNGSVEISGTRLLTFTADAAGRSQGTNTFSSLISWQEGSMSTVQVTVIVINPNPVLNVPSPFTFQGLAGLITRANMSITNSGNSALDFKITNSGLKGAGYSVTNVPFAWEEIPSTSSYMIPTNQVGTFSSPLGFPFSYFGTVYTSAVIRANGSVAFGDQEIAIPYSAGITLDGNSSVRAMSDVAQTKFTVTWQNVAQSGGSSDQTFQAVFNRDGTIRFNYLQMGSGWSNGVVQLRDAATTISTNLVNSQTLISETKTTRIKITTQTTNDYGYVDTSTTYSNQTSVTTRYTDTANRQSLLFTPGKQRIISASPLSGSLAAGASTNIVIIGDARTLKGGGANDVTNSTTLTFSYAGKSTNSLVTFIATNSVQSSYPAFSPLADPVAQASLWGTENPLVSSQVNEDGTRTLSWPAATDGTGDLPRTYGVYYTTSLSDDWILLGTVENTTVFIDRDNIDAPVIFYKVTVLVE